MTRPVLFVCSNQNHVRMLTPVARHIVQKGNTPVVWATLDLYYRHEAQKALAENGWDDWVHLPRPSGASATPWEGGAWARMQTFLQGQRAVRRMLRDANPGVIVLGNDLGSLERLFIHEGHRLNVPSLLVQDGVVALRGQAATKVPLPRRLLHAAMTSLHLRMPDAKGYGQNGADRVAVMGPAVARWLASQGVPRECIAVTGQPAYDRLYHMQLGAAQPESRDALGLPQRQKIVLFSSQPYLRYNMCDETTARRIWRTVIEGVKGLGAGHHLVAKLHPAETPEFTRRWLGEDFPEGWTLTRDADVLGLAFHCDALVTVSSTTALEAIYLGKPTVMLDSGLGALPIPYVESGAALEARNAGELTDKLRQGLYDADTRGGLAAARGPFVREHLYRMDGRATERVAAEILTLTGG